MTRRNDRMLHGARDGAVLAIFFSVLSVMLPTGLGGYNPWNDIDLVTHNLAAIAVRVIVFAMIGAMIGALHRRSRRRRT